jgi:hypothetical protein
VSEGIISLPEKVIPRFKGFSEFIPKSRRNKN